jgi:gamma-glutamylcyclotransferase (GGCT)/AIG2-like uncharacterized protein YtfP
MKKKIVAYGTLRKGFYNFNRFLPDIEYLYSTTIKGYDMYNLGSYPCIVENENSEQDIVVDIVEVTEDAYKWITAMEEGAGYETKTITINNEHLTIYVYPNIPRFSNKIQTGDWSSHL